MSGEQGVDLVRRVIERVETSGWSGLGHSGPPRPVPRDVLSACRLPGDRALSPALAEWLAFDAGLFGWPTPGDPPAFPAMNVAELAQQELGDDALAEMFQGLADGALPGICLPLPFGADSRRFLYLSDPDDQGEYPVLLLDVDDVPFVCVEHPGIDVYLATHAGLLSPPKRVYGAYADDPRFEARMRHHITSALGSRRELQLGEDGFFPPDASAEIPPAAPMVLGPDDPIPAGYVVDRVGIHPFTRQTIRFLKRKT